MFIVVHIIWGLIQKAASLDIPGDSGLFLFRRAPIFFVFLGDKVAELLAARLVARLSNVDSLSGLDASRVAQSLLFGYGIGGKLLQAVHKRHRIIFLQNWKNY